MSRRLVAIETARRVLETSAADTLTPMSSTDMLRTIGNLQHAVASLLAVVDEQPRSERLAIQRDEEFRGLVRAARMEIHGAAGSIRRLDAFEKSLSNILWPNEAEGIEGAGQ